jgi:sulfoxide reductase heme-binding subunit YedZ
MLADAVWYLMRGSGVTALLLLTGVVVLGILTARKASLPTLPRFATMELHRTISLLSVAFLLLHVVTAAADPYAQVHLADVLLPFLGASQALWLGLGTLAFDLLAAVVVSSLLMRRIPRSAWRTIHRAGYAAWPLAFLHGIEQGSDGSAFWLRMLAGGALGVVVAAAGWRLAPLLRARGAVRPTPRRAA